MKIDMHVHTVYSGDSCNSVQDILESCQRVGLDGVVVLDHNSLRGAKEAVALKSDILVIPGVEVSSAEGHILALNVQEEIPRDRTVEETIDLIHAQGGVAVAAHPYRVWSGLGKANVIGKPFDAIECQNGRSTKRGNRLAVELAEAMRKPRTGGSDSHEPESIGRAYTVFPDGYADVDAIMKALLSGKATTVGTHRTGSGTLRYGKKAIGEWICRGMKRM
ncbi:MAG: PHP domain-containing protein [Methanomassiliicoccales archaeon]|jgi:predicted metal-dependent phosphoesterase TrpH